MLIPWWTLPIAWVAVMAGAAVGESLIARRIRRAKRLGRIAAWRAGWPVDVTAADVRTLYVSMHPGARAAESFKRAAESIRRLREVLAS